MCLSLNLLVISELVSTMGVSSSTALSWPHGTEFADSFLKLTTFSHLSFCFSCDHPDFFFFEDIPFAILQRLADVDYRKFLITDKMLWEFSGSSNVFVFGIPATAQTLSRTVFKCIRAEYFDKLVPAAFLSVCFKYYYPQ